jgi:thiol:disulfide interchange protein DsbD
LADPQSQAPQHAHLELIADPAAHSPDAPNSPPKILVGILFHLDPGWHVYWQNPGDSGEPPKIQWNLPVGYRAGSIRWPQPTRLGHGSIVDYGYNNQALLIVPIERTANMQPAPGPSTQIAATVKYLVCQEICIPGKADLTLPISAANQESTQNSNWHSLFAHAEAQIPKKPPASWKISAASDQNNFILTVDTGSVRTRANTSYRAAPRAAGFFPATPSQIDNSTQQQFSGTSAAFTLTLHKSDQLTAPISTLKGVLVVNGSDLNPGTAYEIAAPVTAAAPKGKQ